MSAKLAREELDARSADISEACAYVRALGVDAQVAYDGMTASQGNSWNVL